jgi:hypothetical protein
MALEQAIKPLFFNLIHGFIKGVCTLSLVNPAESQIPVPAIRPTLMRPKTGGLARCWNGGAMQAPAAEHP